MSSPMNAFGGSLGGMLSLVTPAGKVPGTGLLQVSKLMATLTGGGKPNQALLDSVIHELPGLFGGYPVPSEAPICRVLAILFAFIAAGHLYVFGKNYSRGHVFWPSFGLAMYCIFRVIGWCLRLKWSSDIMNVNVGIATAVFCFVPVVYVSVMNMLFGHRIFTWRHPETGNSKWFNNIMFGTYVMVVGVVVMAIVGQAVPYIYFLDQRHLDMCNRVTQAAAVLQTIYSVSGISLALFAYSFRLGSIDHNFGRFYKDGEKVEFPATVSATWLESVHLLYYPRKSSQVKIYKDQSEASAIRVITDQFESVPRSSKHNFGIPYVGSQMRYNIGLILIVSIILTVSSAFRVVSSFNIANHPAPPDYIVPWYNYKWVMYCVFGPLELVINLFYLAMRVDLRFYIPDMPVSRKTAITEDFEGQSC